MVLDSQSPRPGLSRRYMVSRRRRPRRWPWLLVAVAGVAVAGVAVAVIFFFPSGDGGTATSQADVARGGEAAGTGAGAGAGLSGDPTLVGNRVGVDNEPLLPRRAADLPRPARLDENRPTPAPDTDVPTWTLGEPRASSPAASPTPPVAAAPAPSTPATPTPTSTRTPAAVPGRPDSSAPALSELARGMNLIADRRFVDGRRVLSRLLLQQRDALSARDAQAIRDTLTSVNRELIFSKEVHPGDPLTEVYVVQRGDLLARIAPRYHVTYQFLERINRIDARRLQVGQKIKVVKGPFHARIDKSQFRMDILLEESGGERVYICSFPVGLGEDDSTPLGRWIVEEGRKVINPGWRNPRTNEYYPPDDPANPIGEYWIALKGVEPATADLQGYGIHGTIDPASIGQQMSMGCVRLSDENIEQVFYLLVDGHSTVEIVP